MCMRDALFGDYPIPVNTRRVAQARNNTWLATITARLRGSPVVLSFQLRYSSRPIIGTGKRVPIYLLTTSARRSQVVTRCQSVSLRRSPSWPFRMRLVAMLKLNTPTPLGRNTRPASSAV